MADSDLVVANGLQLEAGISSTLEQVAAEGVPVLEVGPALDPLPVGGGHDDHDDHDDHGGGDLDPHVWLDPVRMAAAGEVVAGELAAVTDGSFEQGAAAWSQRMDETHRRMAASLAVVEDDCRVLVTNHDSFGYFADRFDFEVVATVVPGISTDAEPSAGQIADLLDILAQRQVSAIFVEETVSDRTAQTVARQLKDVTVQRVTIATLGGDGPADLGHLLEQLATDVAQPLEAC